MRSLSAGARIAQRIAWAASSWRDSTPAGQEEDAQRPSPGSRILLNDGQGSDSTRRAGDSAVADQIQ